MSTSTSRAAHKRIKPHKASARHRILAFLAKGGRTVDELERFLGLRHQSASARMSELHKAGSVFDTGIRRLTRWGSPAIVWAVAEEIQAKTVELPRARVHVDKALRNPVRLESES